MADRADYLARTLIARLINLQARLAEDGQGAPGRQERIEVIEKVLAVELGITEATTLALIEAAAPQINTSRSIPDQEAAAFAEFLRHRLAAQLSEP